MALISGSNYTVVEGGSPGAWFTPTGTMFLADVDNAAAVTIETRRDSGDANPKPLTDGLGPGGLRVLNGPCCVPVQCVAGRNYRSVAARGSAACAADQ